MVKIIPAILTKNADEISEKIKLLETIPEIDEIQIDFEDGKFVPNSTVLPIDLELDDTRLNLEAHLMVQNPGSFFEQLLHERFGFAFVHYESFKNVHDLITAVKNAKALGLKCGVAINPQTDIAVFRDFGSEIDACLIMTVHPGFQGQTFLSESLERISALRKLLPNAIIEIDGGINLNNFRQVAAQGADRIVIGSGIWQTPDARRTIEAFLLKLDR